MTQFIEKDGMYEITEEAKKELLDSKYYNEDIRPTSVAEKTWNTYNISMLWVGMSICIPSFLMASGCVGMGMSVWVSVINVILGNLIILVPIQLNSFVGTKYGISFPVFSRIVFGMRGAQIPSLSRAITACGWCCVQSALGGTAVLMILNAITGMDVTGKGIVLVGFIIFLIMTWALTCWGEKVIRLFEAVGSPILVILSVMLLIWAIMIASDAGVSFGEVISSNIEQGTVIKDSNGMLTPVGQASLLAFLGGLNGNIGFWATMALNIPDFSRYAKSQKAQWYGQLLGMPLGMAFCAVVGAVYAQATAMSTAVALTDADVAALAGATKPDGSPYVAGDHLGLFSPVDAIGYLHVPAVVVVLIAIGVIIATLTTNIAANVVAPGNGFSNLAPKKISYFWGVTIACILSLGYYMLYMSNAGFMFTFLNIYGGILGPLAAILIVDYWFIKKQYVDIVAVFSESSEGRYWYQGGFNWMAVIAWLAGAILPTLYSIVGATGSTAMAGNSVLTFINTNSWLWSFIIAFIVYALIGKVGAANKKSILSDAEHDALLGK
jgi:NCS1 family nucleobase:cation symporter-1